MKSVLLLLMFLFQTVFSTPCKQGEYVQANGKCKKCSPHCGSRQIKIKECNRTSDIVCKCQKDSYWQESILFCQSCKICEEGEIEVRPCTHENNRNCSRCPLGYYKKSPFKCGLCSVCQEGEVVSRTCLSSQNTICVPQQPSPTIITPILEATDAQDTTVPTEGHVVQQKISKDHTLLLTVSVTALCVVVIIAVMVCLINKYCCPSQMRKKKKSKTGTSSYIADEVSENDTFVNKKIVTHDPGLVVRDLNPEIIDKLGRLLNPPSLSSWRQMAALLQFSQTDISNFGIIKEESCQKVLEAWGTRRGSTVFKLYHIFIKMNRDDCALILEDVLTRDYV